MITFEKIGEILSQIKEKMDFVIIGDTVVDLSLGRKGTESDVDLFPTNFSVLVEYDVLRDLADERGWDMGSTPIDTPRIVVPLGDEQLQVDFYENIQDFFVPPVVIESAEEREIGKDTFKVIKLEDYILLKANAFREEDEEELKRIVQLIGEKKLKIDLKLLKQHSEAFEENSESVRERLSSLGFKLS
ncbi:MULTISPECIES: nucleotidyltransferase [Metallosphaera]|uniref:nucleotidyltransferase n=1 Tax=Metallosphaera TaxID=41980 RepID=UPI001F057BA8|nr:nucleotidyltransferase [Metallosphaera sedula]MCH1770961.1 nucleotidyltransferase [Metallosphaera sedula]MCP6729318.1 nucleotidyltransferase [Metallosphaera sedula]